MAIEGRVRSVNVGRPAMLRIGSRAVPSAIGKLSVEGPVAAAALGLDGDAQADRVNHGGRAKAVYAYAGEDADWWSRRLHSELPPGAFGENLTLDGVDVSDAEVGERWRIGEVELEVTGPRVPCSKLAARFGDPRFVRTFTEARRPGAYLAVTQAGSLAVGDAVEVVARPGHGVSVAEVFSIALLERERLPELDAGLESFGPELREWLAAIRR